MKRFLLTGLLVLLFATVKAEDGYRLWLRYDAIKNTAQASAYRKIVTQLIFPGADATLAAARKELLNGLNGLLKYQPTDVNSISANGSLIIGTPQSSALLADARFKPLLAGLNKDGYFIKSITLQGKNCAVIGANTNTGVLYGVFNFLKLLQTGKVINQLSIADQPATTYRILDHWDNLNRSVERGYAGFSIWNWHKLPEFIDPRYIDYARENTPAQCEGDRTAP